MPDKASYSYVTKHATAPSASWTQRMVLRFHCFNPNGLVQRKRNNDKRIEALVDSGVVPSGWLLAYGAVSNYRTIALMDLFDSKRISSIKLNVAIKMLREECDKVDAKIASVTNKEAA